MNTNRKLKTSQTLPKMPQKDALDLDKEEKLPQKQDDNCGTPEKRYGQHVHQSKTRHTRTKEDENQGIVIPKPIRKRAWTEQEDQLLRQLVAEWGPQDWSSIADNFWSRGGKQCRQRWHNHLREGVTKKPWTNDEEWILALAVKAFGHKWSKISRYLPGRTDNTIKNHWNCKMRPKKSELEEQILFLLNYPDLEDDAYLSLQELELIEIIKKSKNHMVSWDREEVSRNEFRHRCRQALIDFYRLQNFIADNGIDLLFDMRIEDIQSEQNN